MPHAPAISVQYASPGWATKLNNAFNGRNHVRIVIKGTLASELKGKLSFPSVFAVPAAPFSALPIPFPNVSNCLAGVPALLSPVVSAFATKGYTTFKASFDAHGSGKTNDELVFDLR